MRSASLPCFLLWLGITKAMVPNNPHRAPLLDGGGSSTPPPFPNQRPGPVFYNPEDPLKIYDVSFRYTAYPYRGVLQEPTGTPISINSFGTWTALYLPKRVAAQKDLYFRLLNLSPNYYVTMSPSSERDMSGSFCVVSLKDMQRAIAVATQKLESKARALSQKTSVSSQQGSTVQIYPDIRRVLQYYVDEFSAKPFDWENQLICFGHWTPPNVPHQSSGRTFAPIPQLEVNVKPLWDLEEGVIGKMFNA